MSSDWKALASQEANRQNCPVDIVLATVEAETGGRNITGDNGNALGYGQVWVKWHRHAFEYAAQLLGLPTPPTDLPFLTTYTLSNNQYSMAVAVNVIKRNWDAAGGKWANFTYSYVGPGIPASDFQRRQNIWNKYRNSDFDYTGAPAFLGTANNLIIPKTNYEVVAGSAKTGDILYGRRYRVIVSSLDGEQALDVSDLRCTFNTVKIIQAQPQYSQIVIYNLSPQTENAIIREGYRVVIEAGYEGSSQYGLIFDGNVVQPIRNKESGTTYTLTLIAADSDVFLNYSLSAFSIVRGQNNRAVLENLTSKGTIPTQLGNVSQALARTNLTRGKVVFGLTRDYLRQLAQSEGATYYMENGKVNIIKAEDVPEGEIINLSPETGLIGVPAQTDYGVTIRMLLNPRVKINSLIHVDNSLIRNAQYGQGQPIYTLDSDGIYRVIKVTNIGDTRGNDWYTEVETVTQSGMLPGVIANGGQSPW